MYRTSPQAKELESLGVSASERALQKKSKDLQAEVIDGLRGKGMSRVKVSRVCEFANRHMISHLKKESAVRHSHRFKTAKPEEVAAALGAESAGKTSSAVAAPRSQGDGMQKESSGSTDFQSLLRDGRLPSYGPVPGKVVESAAPQTEDPDEPLLDRMQVLRIDLEGAAEATLIKASSALEAVKSAAGTVVREVDRLQKDRPDLSPGELVVTCYTWAAQKVSAAAPGEDSSAQWRKLFSENVARWVYSDVDMRSAQDLAKHSQVRPATVSDLTETLSAGQDILPLAQALTKMASATVDYLAWLRGHQKTVHQLSELSMATFQTRREGP
jgi:hypothetical protein